MRTFLLIGDRLFRLRICRRIGSPTLVLRQLHVFSLSGLSFFSVLLSVIPGTSWSHFSTFASHCTCPPHHSASLQLFYRNKSLSFPVFPLRQLCYSVSCGLRLESCMIAHCSLETPWSGKSRSPFSFMLYAPLNCDGGGREGEREPRANPPPPPPIHCSLFGASSKCRQQRERAIEKQSELRERKNRTSCQVRR